MNRQKEEKKASCITNGILDPEKDRPARGQTDHLLLVRGRICKETRKMEVGEIR